MKSKTAELIAEIARPARNPTLIFTQLRIFWGEEKVVVGGGKNWAERYITSKAGGGRGAFQSVLPLTPSVPVPRVVGVSGGGRDGGQCRWWRCSLLGAVFVSSYG